MGNGPTEDIVSFGLTLFLCSIDLPRFDAIDPSDIACDARSSNPFISVIFLESLGPIFFSGALSFACFEASAQSWPRNRHRFQHPNISDVRKPPTSQRDEDKTFA
jgi:hypothetical protein